MLKGTKKRLKNDYSHWYVKLEDKDFAWWRFEKNQELKEEKRPRVRMTDEMVTKENHFEIF